MSERIRARTAGVVAGAVRALGANGGRVRDDDHYTMVLAVLVSVLLFGGGPFALAVQ